MQYAEKLNKADISISSSGDNTIIAAPTDGAYIVIDHINLVPASAVTVQLQAGATAYGGAYTLDTKQGFVLENAMHNDDGVITLPPNTAFVINLGGAVAVAGFVRYRFRNR